MTRARGSHLLAAILLLALAGGCSRGDDGEREQAAQPNPTPVEQPTPSPEPVEDGTPEAADAPPELHLVGDDYGRVVRSHTAFRNWLFRHPDPDLLDEIVHPGCECYIEKDLLASYVERGLHWTGTGPGIVVNQVEVVDDQARNLVHLQVVLERQEPGELVDADGTVHDRVEPREPWLEDLVFVRDDPQSPWRLRDFTDRGPVEEAPDS